MDFTIVSLPFWVLVLFAPNVAPESNDAGKYLELCILFNKHTNYLAAIFVILHAYLSIYHRLD